MSGLGQESEEPVPVGPPLCNPLVGEDLSHGLGADLASRIEFNPDHLSIDTPELVAIEMPLAGIGSRFHRAAGGLPDLGRGLVLVFILALLFCRLCMRSDRSRRNGPRPSSSSFFPVQLGLLHAV